ncbi:MAG: hypothetical protein C3F11_01665 [Methylocystaceae bacterium]|nr:MAG: hypothetical protein C3F11_01665 [Methylocystaceae bacterium]
MIFAVGWTTKRNVVRQIRSRHFRIGPPRTTIDLQIVNAITASQTNSIDARQSADEGGFRAFRPPIWRIRYARTSHVGGHGFPFPWATRTLLH